jgi:lysophospholipase L1-like esterase
MPQIVPIKFLVTLLLTLLTLRCYGDSASFAEFDRKARAGEPLSIVFFGGSLTWGANASDPQTTSWRGLMMDYLRKTYPRAPFTFYDASIGGTGSKLGMFRLQRDVLSKKPDLVFYDFTVNDGDEGSDIEPLASYEGNLRKMIGQGIPVVQEFFLFKYHTNSAASLKQSRYLAHKKLAEAYHTAAGDARTTVLNKVLSGEADRNSIWPADGAHPYDEGYHLFFEAVRDGLEQAIQDKRTCQVPATPIFSNLYEKTSRQILVDQPIPSGWYRHTTSRTSLWFDNLSSRWMGDLVACNAKNEKNMQTLRVSFNGTLVALLGEKSGNGLSFKVKVDGKPLLYKAPGKEPSDIWPNNLQRFTSGWKESHLLSFIELSDKLKAGKHILEIEPVFDPQNPDGELAIESVCSAGE